MRLPMLGPDVCFVRRYSWLLAAVAVLFLTTASAAELSEPVTRIEEDWGLVLLEPDGDVLAPQFYTTMSPFEHLDAFYAQITWNYRELPEFVPGGFQVQGWLEDEVVRLKSIGSEKFSVSAETVTWTQMMVTNGAETAFLVINGQSQTWGSFGGSETIVAGLIGASDLNSYNPDLSVANSWVTYGANRVSFLGIVEVRYYGSSGLLYTDTTTRVVFACE